MMSRRFSTLCRALVLAAISLPSPLLAQSSDGQPVCGDSQSSHQSDDLVSLMRALNGAGKNRTGKKAPQRAEDPPQPERKISTQQTPTASASGMRNSGNANAFAAPGNVATTNRVETVPEDQPGRLELRLGEVSAPLPLPPLPKKTSSTASRIPAQLPIFTPTAAPATAPSTAPQPLPARPMIARVQSIEPLPAPPEFKEPSKLSNGGVCEDCDALGDEPSRCEACEELLNSGDLMNQPTRLGGKLDESDLGDVNDLEDELDDWEGSDAQGDEAARRRDLRSRIRPIQELDFDRSFVQLEKLTDDYEPTQNSNRTSRDPYYGTQDVRIEKFWTARNLAHRNLYFEDTALERYGWAASPTKQAFLSTAEFIKDSILFPVRHARQGKCDLHYVLGYERPGTCAPRIVEDDMRGCR